MRSTTHTHGAKPGKRTPNKKAAGGRTTTATKSVSIADSTGDLTLTTTGIEARIDSRLLAKHLGNKHKNTMELGAKHLTALETFGKVAFKTEALTSSATGQKGRYALLNEDHSLFLLALSRNTPRVVSLKVKLIQAFSNARRAADLRKTDYLPVYHALHDQIKVLAAGSPNERFMHINCNKALNKFAGLTAGQRASAPVPNQALLIVGQMMMTQAMHAAKDPYTGFQRAKDSLLALTACTMLEVAQ